jgi:hypothetical protein
VIKEYELPIGATKKGFFLIETSQELNEEIAKLTRRAISINDRAKRVRANYQTFYAGKQQLLGS